MVAAALARAARLPAGALAALFARYGRPLAAEFGDVAPLATVPLGDGATLQHRRLRATVDVIANDWFVYAPIAAADEPTAAPLAMPGPLFAAAVAALARATSGSSA